MKFVCQFIGGYLNGTMAYDEACRRCDGRSEDLSEIRKVNRYAVHRPELDNQPTFEGYIGPMWDGTRNINGVETAVLRYETPEVYDMLSR